MKQGEVPSPPADWYRDLAAHLGKAYLRYSFTKNTAQEAEFLFDLLALSPGMRLLDVGCGPGRHCVALAAKGVDVVGIDLSPDFIAIARDEAKSVGVSASFFEMDALQMPFEDEFDAVISICEGAFSLGLDDLGILKRMASAVRPSGRLAVAGVNLFYVLTHMREAGEFDLGRMMFKETVEAVIGSDGQTKTFEMWNSCYTPREMEWIANGAGLDPMAVYGIEPGNYRQQMPTIDHPELLLLASKP